jgi:hypothetical protein
MKHVTTSLFALILLAGCNTATTSDQNNDSATAGSTSNEPVTYAYPVNYSSDLEIGDPKLAQTVLAIWKDFDNNTLDDHKDAFADSVTVDLSGGDQVKGPRDSVIANIKAYRSSLKSVVNSIDVVTTLKPKGKDETWVCVWAKEVSTDSKNKVDSTFLQENWMFNKDGKISYVGQYAAKPVVKK